ncbi:MAG TPA: HAD hydrolase-like protein [Candidatus Tumulicola sp.]|jgi:beta-phosphoglucomutase-like phosphatase (HAD superfamily)
MPAFDLIIFDCDGVLVDSEPIANAVFAEMLGELGWDFSLEEMYEQFVGRSMATCLDLVAKMRGAPVPKTFAEDYGKRSLQALRERVVAIQGVREVIADLATPYCVTSSGDHHKMRTTLGSTDLLDLFEGKMFSATDVARGKPFPDVYLLAASRSGVESGVAAGMTVFASAGVVSAQRLVAAGACAVFDDMREPPTPLPQE